MKRFLGQELSLELHPNKVSIKTLASGVDFLGWVHFPDHRVLRNVTKRRVVKGLKSENESRKNSYLGLCKWGDTHKIINADVAGLNKPTY